MKGPVGVSVNLRAIDGDSRSIALALGVRYLREINEGGIDVQERERERERERLGRSERVIDSVLKARNGSPAFHPFRFGARELGSTNPFRAKDPRRA